MTDPRHEKERDSTTAPSNDKKAFETYSNPANRVPAGRGRRLPEKPLSTHVPVRFPPQTVMLVKYFAAQDGLTVSSWIRREVDRAIRRRVPAPQYGMDVPRPEE